MTIDKNPKLETMLFPLSFEQKSHWHVLQASYETERLNTVCSIQWLGSVNPILLERCLNTIVQRHSALRTCFSNIEESPQQRVYPSIDVSLNVIGNSTVDSLKTESEKTREIRDFSQMLSKQTFNLAQIPLFRFTLLRSSENEATLFLSFHHLIIDYFSLNLFIEELASLYDAWVQNQPSPLPAVETQYTDIVNWQQHQLWNVSSHKDYRYWAQTLDNLPKPATFFPDHSTSVDTDLQSISHPFRIDSNLWSQVKVQCQKQGVTSFVVLLTILKILIYRCSEQNDIVVGVATTGRSRPRTRSVIGLFTEALALRSQLSHNLTFETLLGQVFRSTLRAYAHQNIPFCKIIDSLDTEKNRFLTQPFNIIISYMEGQFRQIEMSQNILRVSWDASTYQTDLDIFFGVKEVEEELEGVWIYNPKRFEEKTIIALIESYRMLLEQCVLDASMLLTDFELAAELSRFQELAT